MSLKPHNELSINFADPDAVRTLNRALLKHFYGVSGWDIPPGYLCPPVPGRADYLHYLADLLGDSNHGVVPRGDAIRVLDVGVGANCIYPILGHCEYGWSFVGSDIDQAALESARRIIRANPTLSASIELRLQSSSSKIFTGLLKATDVFDLSVCNPPFHSSSEEAEEGSRRKWKNLGLGPRKDANRSPHLNFGGQGGELWCPGGEVAFVRRMIAESGEFSKKVLWFSALISKESSLRSVYEALKKAGSAEYRTVNMAQGQKRSRFVAWTFFEAKQREDWRSSRLSVDPDRKPDR